MEARAEHEEAAAAEKAAAQDKRTRELEVHEAMVAAGWKGEHKFDLGPPWGVQGFTPKATTTGDVYSLEEMKAWARERGLERTLFGDPSVQKAAVNQMVKRAMRGQADLPAGVEPFERPFVSVRDIK
jgi:hypothetical protein